MKKVKITIWIITAIVMLCSLCSCGESNDHSISKSSSTINVVDESRDTTSAVEVMEKLGPYDFGEVLVNEDTPISEVFVETYSLDSKEKVDGATKFVQEYVVKFKGIYESLRKEKDIVSENTPYNKELFDEGRSFFSKIETFVSGDIYERLTLDNAKFWNGTYFISYQDNVEPRTALEELARTEKTLIAIYGTNVFIDPNKVTGNEEKILRIDYDPNRIKETRFVNDTKSSELLNKYFQSVCGGLNKVLLSKEISQSEIDEISQLMAGQFLIFDSNFSGSFRDSQYERFSNNHSFRMNGYLYTGTFEDEVDFIDKFYEFIFGEELLKNSQRIALASKIIFQ